ncbi:glutathione transferase F4 [Hordeum vulgare]|nr:glutathione transferase F4 [Hordeum vulgare]
MKLYGWAVSPWMARVLVCLEESGAEYELVPMSRNGGDHRRPEHLARNLGYLTSVGSKKQSDDQLRLRRQGHLLTLPFPSNDSAALRIPRHRKACSKPELLGAAGSLEESAMVDVWVDVDAHQLEPVLQPIVWNCIINPFVGRDVNQGLVDESVKKLKKVLEVYEARLSSSKYLAGDFVSFADLTHFSFMRYFMATEHAIVLDAYPHVKAWWEALLARPPVKKVMAGMPPDFGFGSGRIP